MRTRHAVIVGMIVCLVAVVSIQAETYPGWKPGVYPPTEQPSGFRLTKCGHMTGATAQYDSVVAPLNWRIARLDISSIQGATTEILYLAIKQAYSGTHLDSFPTDPSASRAATSNTSGTTVAVLPRVSTKLIQDYEYFMNTDKLYMHAASVDATWNLSWCAYLVRIMNSSEDRTSNSTIGVYGVDARSPNATAAQKYEASAGTVDFPILSFLEL